MAGIEVGKKAPAFTLLADSGSVEERGSAAREPKKMSLADHAGKWLVLYFYPRDDTPGCTTEAIEFSKAIKKLAKLSADVVGVSKDTFETHCKFRNKHKLGLTLLSDPDAKVIEKYGAWGEKNLYGKKSLGVIRTTVLIDPQGVVRKIYARVKVAGHVEKVLEDLAALA